MRIFNVKKSSIIFEKGDPSKTMYLIRSGKIGIYNNYGKTNEAELAVLDAGKFFGEMGVIENEVRSADAVALSDCELVEIAAEDFADFVKTNTSDVITIMENLSSRLRVTTKDMKEASEIVDKYVASGKAKSKKVSILASVGRTYKKLFGLGAGKCAAPKAKYEDKEVIFKQYQSGDCMFKIMAGEVSFYLNYGESDEQLLATIGKGEVFGEMSVIEQATRSATAIAKGEVEVKPVVKSDLATFLEQYPDDALKIMKNLSSKLRGTTANYVDILKTISDFVREEREVGGDISGFSEYVNQYNYYMANGCADFTVFSNNPDFFI